MPRVLLVNDDQDVAEVAKALLESRGYQVETVGGSQRALDQAAHGKYDVFILDFDLGEAVNGAELAYALRHRMRARAPIVLISVEREAEALGRRAGVDAFVAKPFSFDELMSALNQV